MYFNPRPEIRSAGWKSTRNVFDVHKFIKNIVSFAQYIPV